MSASASIWAVKLTCVDIEGNPMPIHSCRLMPARSAVVSTGTCGSVADHQELVVTSTDGFANAGVRQNVRVPTYPDAAVLYPEVAATGSLAAALRAAADRQGLSMPVEVVEHSPLVEAVVPTTVPHRQPLGVSAGRAKRRWSLRGCEPDQGMALIEGATADLDQIVKAAQAWRGGEPLTRIAEMAPFVELTGRFEVFGRDPAQMVESEWQHLLVEAAGTDWPEYRALIDAAYNEPRLRRLYPFTSHWALRFSTRTRPHLSREIHVCIHHVQSKEYVVTRRYQGEEIGRTLTAEDAVSLAIQHLPASLGTTTYGAV